MNAVAAVAQPVTRIRQRPTRQLDLGPGPAIPAPGHNQPPAEPVANQPSPEIVAKVGEFVRLNAAANSAASKAKKAKEELDKLIEQASVKHTDFLVEVDGRNYQVTNLPSSSEAVDMAIVRKEVTDEVFMKIVAKIVRAAKGGKGAVSDEAGRSVMNRAIVTINKDAEVKVKEQK